MLLCNRGLGQGVLGGKPFGGAGWSQGRTGASSSGKASRLRAAKSPLVNLSGVATPRCPVPKAGQAVLTRGASSCHTWLCSTPRPVSLSGKGENISLPFCTFGRSLHWVRSYKALPTCNSELLCKLQLVDGLLLQLWRSQAGILPG